MHSRGESFFLKVRPAERDIIPRPRVPMFCLEDTDLHFGCLVKENVLSVLWKAKGVAVKFGFDMKTISFYLSYNCKKTINLNYLTRVYGRCSFTVHLLIGRGQSSF